MEAHLAVLMLFQIEEEEKKEATYLSMEHITERIQTEAEVAAHVGSALISYCFLSGCARFPPVWPSILKNTLQNEPLAILSRMSSQNGIPANECAPLSLSLHLLPPFLLFALSLFRISILSPPGEDR